MAAIRPAFCGEVLVAVRALTRIWFQSMTSSAADAGVASDPAARAAMARAALNRVIPLTSWLADLYGPANLVRTNAGEPSLANARTDAKIPHPTPSGRRTASAT